MNDCLFFTKNGKFLGIIEFEIKKKTNETFFYPIIGSRTNGAKFEVNFGSKDFRFDLKDFKPLPMNDPSLRSTDLNSN